MTEFGLIAGLIVLGGILLVAMLRISYTAGQRHEEGREARDYTRSLNHLSRLYEEDK